ncbi:hypothetical protein RIEGSTA812A_PEG_872 [invertebrate metagenome]|uniref:Uncharacterized protein n=1 Tax=invertebrate metagenome TaxID=1711999 RepID=A0A484H5V5_9ZZZZ
MAALCRRMCQGESKHLGILFYHVNPVTGVLRIFRVVCLRLVCGVSIPDCRGSLPSLLGV